MIEISPETKLLFRSKKLEEIWRPRIKRITRAFMRLEFETFLRGMRDLYIYHYHSEKPEEIFDLLNKYHLSFYPTRRTAIYRGFSHKHIRPVSGEPFYLFGALVKDPKIGEEFVRKETDHTWIGLHLGYPKCCIDFFNKVWYSKSIDPIWEIAANTENAEISGRTVQVEIHPFCNQALRYFGIRITPHLPCSFTCERTVEMGEEWFKIFKEIDQEAAEWALEILSLPFTWDCLYGVAVIDTDLFKGITNSDGVLEKKVVINRGWST